MEALLIVSGWAVAAVLVVRLFRVSKNNCICPTCRQEKPERFPILYKDRGRGA